MIKIAVVTEDKKTVCRHFGRAPYYLVFSAEGDNILEKEIRGKAGHHTFAGSAADTEPHHHEGHHHGGHHPDHKHNRMIETIRDCEVVIVGGMGEGARRAMQDAGITACSTELEEAEEAVRAYLGGGRMGVPDCGRKAAEAR